jgi:hypothetical protein
MEERMRQVRGQAEKPEDVLTPLNQRKRLVNVVSQLVREIERLHEDNSQLRAAVEIYREVARQSAEGRR